MSLNVTICRHLTCGMIESIEVDKGPAFIRQFYMHHLRRSISGRFFYYREEESEMAKESRKWFYNSVIWKNARQTALRRDGFTCLFCGSRATEVHHVIELTDENITDRNISLNPNNLQSLCHDCHRVITMKEHGRKQDDCNEEYYFDSNGHIQRKVPPGSDFKNWGK